MAATRFVVLLIIILFAACESPDLPGKKLLRSEIPGRYEANFETHGEHFLVILEDSTYEHHYTTPNGQLYVDKGMWEFKVVGYGLYTVYLNQYVWRHHKQHWKSSSPKVRALSLAATTNCLKAVKRSSEIRLEFDYAKNSYRKKITPKKG